MPCRPRTAAGLASALALALAGCGGDREFANDERPPAAITLSASITPRTVTVSPARIGAGTVELLASNQTSVSQEITLRSDSGADGPAPAQRVEQRTGPINPGDTASLTADLAQGTYRVSAGSQVRRPARIRVGPRAGPTDGLLQP